MNALNSPLCMLATPNVFSCLFFFSELTGAGVDCEDSVPEVPALYQHRPTFREVVTTCDGSGKSPHPHYRPILILTFLFSPLPNKEIPSFLFAKWKRYCWKIGISVKVV